MQEQLKELPIGESDIKNILNNNFIYVDKTELIYEMVRIPSKYFLSRPRRFGKSTLLSTLHEVFKGNKELFKDQWIYNSDWSWEEYPIIRLDFNVEMSTDLDVYIKQALKSIAIAYDVFNEGQYNESSYGMYFRHLVENLRKTYNQQVAILIDEYDKPILDVIENIAEAEKKRDILKGFYGIMKGMDENVRFIFLTGVSRFSKVGVFSGLNNLNDISMDKSYAAVCGITEDELLDHYKGYIMQLAEATGISYDECLAKIKEWYNGFCFSRNTEISVYNPFSTLLLFQKQDFSNYWFASGNPSFLLKLIKQDRFASFEQYDEYHAESTSFDSFELDYLNLIALLFQTGYLTIKDYDKVSDYYTLSYPNHEIRHSFKKDLFASLGVSRTVADSCLFRLYDAFNKNQLELAIIALKEIFLNLDYDIKIAKESHYQGVVYLIFQLLGYRIQTEYKTSIGRIDAIIQTASNVYIFEFKLDKTAIIAMKQIHENRYYDRFVNQNKGIYLIGINFSSEKRCIDDYIIEELV